MNQAANFKEEPKCRMYYVTTGRWNNDPNHLAIINAAKNDLETYNIFEEINFYPTGATELSKLYRQTKTPNAAEFIFSEKVTLPEIKGINEAYYGRVAFSEFKKILIDDNDNIRSIFDDNVRDFQGPENPVNSKISSTLESENSERFVVFNNGVTVVANSLKTSGNKFIISDFQIVNGCQTSNILYQNRNNENIQSLYVPFRLIVTDNDSVKSQITLATNSQTAIKTEQLAVLSDFQRNLELYYAATEGDGKLYYERRAKQYSNDNTVVKNRIITVANQIKSFSAIFLQNPHLVTSFFGSIAKKLGSQGSKIFKEDHSYAPYYLSGLAFYKIDSLFRSGSIDGRYRKVKFHLLMVFRLLAEDREVPPLNSQKKMEKYCEPIIKKLLDPQICNDLFKRATEILDESEMDLSDKQHFKQAIMVDKILDKYRDMANVQQ
ncbi:MAG: AIPR family protein [Prochloraceae cyanobacterium]